jgi:hypothetical protein
MDTSRDIQQNRRRDALDISMLIKQVGDMYLSVKNGEPDLEIKYCYLFEKVPSVFMLLKDNEMPKEQLPFLIYMIKQAGRVQIGEIDAYQTDVDMGKILAEKYIFPVINDQN